MDFTLNLMTKELEQRFKEVGSQKSAADPIVIAKFFHASAPWTWHATEYEPNEKIFYGLVCIAGIGGRWAHFSIDELVREVGYYGIERDLACGEFPVSDLFEIVPTA